METRVEKYRKLREQIQSTNGEEITTKVKTSQRAQQFLDEKDNQNISKMDTSTIAISYKEIMDAYSIYDKEHPKEKDLLESVDKKRKIFLIVGLSLITTLLVALIIVGIILLNKGV